MADKLIRRHEVYALTGLTRYATDELEKVGKFPKRIQLGKRNIYWSRDQVLAFIASATEQG